jgi:hypothetical protein
MVSFLRMAACMALPVLLQAQCSDAGACAVGRFSTASNRLALTEVEAGSGSPDQLRFHTQRLDGQFQLGTSTRLSIAVPLVQVNGPLGSAQGLGDVVALVDQTFASGDTGTWAVQFGGRLATGKADQYPALPQAYQTGLGPSDLIVGVRGAWGTWQSGFAFQKAGSRNENPLTRLKRGNDALLWVGHQLTLGETELSFKTLAIKRLSLSSVRDPRSISLQFIDVPDSDRLQVNFEAGVSHPITQGLSLQMGAAIPFLKRPSNVDGLKRSWTASLGVAWAF